MDKFIISDVFKNRDERNTVLLAFLVLLFFGWLIYHLAFSSENVEKNFPTAIPEKFLEENPKPVKPNLSTAVVAEEVATQSVEDQDGDGVYDADDECPNKTGAKEQNGCPVIELEEKEKATLELAVNAVQFQLNKATLKTNSLLILNDILKILKKYPDYHLRIEGHTDSQGAAAGNLQLSKDRAATCYAFFTARGISANRLEYGGYGETRPVAPNNTAAGRVKNRRVQFNLFR